jgi:hypothetical protein
MFSDRLEVNLLNCLGLFVPHQPRKYAQFLGATTKHSNGSAMAIALGGWSVHVYAGVNLSETLYFPACFLPINKTMMLQSKYASMHSRLIWDMWV